MLYSVIEPTYETCIMPKWHLYQTCCLKTDSSYDYKIEYSAVTRNQHKSVKGKHFHIDEKALLYGSLLGLFEVWTEHFDFRICNLTFIH